MIFIYDKENDLKLIAKSKKQGLAIFYLSEGSRLISLENFKEKNKNCSRRVVVDFKEDIKLQYFSLGEYEYSIRAIAKKSDRIKFPKEISRIETDLNGTPKSFSVKSDIINSLINRI
jgi:hypothetical protein